MFTFICQLLPICVHGSYMAMQAHITIHLLLKSSPQFVIGEIIRKLPAVWQEWVFNLLETYVFLKLTFVASYVSL